MKDRRVEEGIRKVWNKLVPLKVTSFAWRLLQNRIPSCDNLYRRGIISQEHLKYVFCEAEMESSLHLFLTCDVSYKVWCVILKWLGFSLVIHRDIVNQFWHFQRDLQRLKIDRLWGQLYGLLSYGLYGWQGMVTYSSKNLCIRLNWLKMWKFGHGVGSKLVNHSLATFCQTVSQIRYYAWGNIANNCMVRFAQSSTLFLSKLGNTF